MAITLGQIRKQLGALAGDPATTGELDFSVAKQQAEERYTLGVMYVPGARDSDNEFAEGEDLQKAVWDYVRSGYRKVRDTHTQREIGELVELVCWPYPVEIDAQLPNEPVRKYKLPAGTVFAGVIWEPEAWTEVQRGKLRGYSLGGRAVRMKNATSDDQLPRMAELTGGAVTTKSDDCGCGGDSVVKGKAPRCPLGNKPGKTNWVERTGGLPEHIKIVAEAIHCKVGDESRAIAFAVASNHRWCENKGGKVTAKTQAISCKAIAEWDAKRAAAHAEHVASKMRKSVVEKYGDQSQQVDDGDLGAWLDATDHTNCSDEELDSLLVDLPHPDEWEDLKGLS